MIHRHLLAAGLFIGVILVFAVAAALSGEDEGRGAQDNSYMESATYVGSDTCGNCHAANYASWQDTLHTKKVRPISEAIVLADFSIDPSLSGGGVPETTIDLYHEEGTDNYYADLAGNNYTIDWVLGSGTWKQRFMVDIENGTFILPIQWNTATGEWGAYHMENWFDANGDPLAIDWGFGAEPVKQVDLTKSWQKNCAGCHTTGNVPTQNGNGEWISNYAELNIGCESCHGPGSEHVAGSGDETKIWDSGDAQVCAQCHVRGKSLDGEHGFPVGMYPGDDVEDYYDLATNVFWPDGNTSKKHHQQYMDWNISGHANPTPSFARRAPCVNCHTPEGAKAKFAGEELTEVPTQVTWQVTCVACHDPHGSEYEQDLLADIEDLCITCHTANGVAPPDTPHHPMYEMLTGQGGAGIIGDLRMGGAVTCTDCHMPKVAKSAVEWDISSHTFQPLEPSLTIEFGMPNSCTSNCHNGVGPGGLLTVETADRVVRSWHREVGGMLLYVEDNLTLAEFAIADARAQGVDDELIAEAEDLYAIAEFNYELVLYEGSRGVHNFEYARALLFDSYSKAQEIVTLLNVTPPENMPPVAEAGDPMIIEPGATATFDGTESHDPDGTTLSYTWDFGGGDTATGATATHTYTDAGTYTVTLTVTDTEGATDTDTVMVYVMDMSKTDETPTPPSTDDDTPGFQLLGTVILVTVVAVALRRRDCM